MDNTLTSSLSMTFLTLGLGHYFEVLERVLGGIKLSVQLCRTCTVTYSNRNCR